MQFRTAAATAIVITETGCENLTPGLPRSVAEIEAFMKR